MTKQNFQLQLFIDFIRTHRNPEQQVPMEAYMRNQFRFLGITSPERKQLMKDFFTHHHTPKKEDWFKTCNTLYFLPEREFQYLAMELAYRGRKHLSFKHISLFYDWLMYQSWWDTVDFIAPKLIGPLILDSRTEGEEIMRQWLTDDSFWIKRAALLHQLKYKEQMNEDFLFHAIDQLHTSTEFFIEKAIGWVLREYAKTNPLAVQKYVATHPLRPLSKREALKHVGALASN